MANEHIENMRNYLSSKIQFYSCREIDDAETGSERKVTFYCTRHAAWSKKLANSVANYGQEPCSICHRERQVVGDDEYYRRLEIDSERVYSIDALPRETMSDLAAEHGRPDRVYTSANNKASVG